MYPKITVPLLGLFAFLLIACGGPESSGEGAAPPPLPDGDPAYAIAGTVELEDMAAEDWPDLHNVFRLSENIISGSEPHGDAALKRISEMGVKTILSVDGKAPDVETAATYGMRYVHVPIQYSGIPARERLRIAKFFREQEGPFYVHCFHGKHRGPAAAALGRVVLDGATRERAIAEMRNWCGTSAKYPRLYETVARASLPSPDETSTYAWDFPSAHTFVGFRQAMVEVSRPFDHLKALAGRNWEVDPEHPDLNAAHEAARMLEVFEVTVALEDTIQRPSDFRLWLDESVEHTNALRAALVALATGEGDAEPVMDAYREVASRCADCHLKFRNE